MEQILSTDKLMKIIEKLYFIRHSKFTTWFIHDYNGLATPLEGTEGAAFFNEEQAEKVLKSFRGYEAIKVIDLAKEIPIVLSGFPAGHPLHGAQVCVRDFTITKN